MPLVPMTDMLNQAKSEGYAVGAFNVVDYPSMLAVVAAAEEVHAPVIMQASASSTVNYYGSQVLLEMARCAVGTSKLPVSLHLDHCSDLQMICQCIQAGWPSVMFDGSALSFERNVAESKRVVASAHLKGASVEGEIGSIWGVEDHLDVAESDQTLADPDATVQYVEETGVDAVAPAIGTAHGLYLSEPKLDFARLQNIAGRVPVPVVIHGGTGLAEKDIHQLIALGGAKVNVSTQIKIGMFDAIQAYLAPGTKKNPIALYKQIQTYESGLITNLIRMFGSSGKG